MKVLIVGKDGQLGNSLIQQLQKNSEIVFSALSRKELDITNATRVNQVVSKLKPDFIINAAAYTAVDNAEKEVVLANKINIEGPRNLAIAACQNNACIMHISTDYVFSGNKSGLYSETDIVDPQGIYGQSKLDGEIAVTSSCPKNIISVRI